MISDQVIAELKARADIVEIIGSAVELRKQGREWVGLCPFHVERSPSFSVNKGKVCFRCWGCGESGDIYNWYMKTRGIQFGDAVKVLADHLGVELNGAGNGKAKDYDPGAMAKAREESARIQTEAQNASWDRMSRHLTWRWARLDAASADDPYLKRKGVTDATGLKVTKGGRLLVPMKDVETGRIMSVQAITPRFKRFAKRGRAMGLRHTVYWSPDAVRDATSGAAPIYLAEGLATAWSVAQATQGVCVVAFSAHNLTPVARAMRARYPTATMVIAADNDRWTGKGDRKNAGHRYATEAAIAVGALVVLPSFATGCQDAECDRKCGKAHPTDFNDLMAAEGMEAVAAQLHSAAAPPPPVATEPEAPADLDPDLDLTHDGLALELGEEWRYTGRHVAAWGRWLFFDGQYWVRDDVKKHMGDCRDFLRDKARALMDWAKGRAADLLADTGDETASKKPVQWAEAKNSYLRSTATTTAVLVMTSSNTNQAATIEQWNADPWLMGTPGGTLDLHTGTLRAAQYSDYITMTARSTPAAPGTEAPIWTRFLDRITDGDERLQAYLQRFAGYSLTGLIEEHAFVFGYGTGGNGKGTFINTLASIMGDYSVPIPVEMLMATNNDRHPTELARLHGIRLAVGSETEEGRKWAEAKIKSLTGGDRIAGRFMHKDFFEFDPTFKLFVIGNKRPTIQGVDEAMRRRLHLVPFTVQIPAEEKILDLSDKLKAEWPAIFRWMVDGCMAWQETHLDPPAVVRAASESYLAAEDSLTLWIEECCDPRRDGAEDWEPSGLLWASWRSWAERAGEQPGTQKRFAQVLGDRGFAASRKHGGVRCFTGIKLKPTHNDQEARRYGERD